MLSDLFKVRIKVNKLVVRFIDKLSVEKAVKVSRELKIVEILIPIYSTIESFCIIRLIY